MGFSLLRASRKYPQSSGHSKVTSRCSPQQMAQISPSTAGHLRLARRWPQSLHTIGSAISYKYHRSRNMKRVDIYVKVEVELDEDELPERVAREICRQVEKMYIVRKAEPSHVITRD
jgi:hypothetical protein